MTPPYTSKFLLVFFFLPTLLYAQKAEYLAPKVLEVYQDGTLQSWKQEDFVIRANNRYYKSHEFVKLREKKSDREQKLSIHPVFMHQGHPYILTHKLLLKLKNSNTLDVQAKIEEKLEGHPYQWTDEPMGLSGYVLLQLKNTLDLSLLLEEFKEMPELEYVQPLFARQFEDRDLPNDPLLLQQWHIQNNFPIFFPFTPADVNVLPVWGENYGDGFLGRGVRIGCVDSGLDTQHPDLLNQVDTLNDIDFNEGDGDPRPLFSDPRNSHGTSVAGLVAAQGDNGLGTIGVAPEAQLLGIRLTFTPVDDETEAQALNYLLSGDKQLDIYNNSWGPSDDGLTKEAPGILTEAALRLAVQSGRDGKGAIFTWAAGNGRDRGDNANYDGYANSIYTIAVGAISFIGQATTYSEPGANVLIVAPSGGELLLDEPQITTTIHSEFAFPYTTGFNGTSASTPLVSGLIALMLEANPDLGWRDVQEILIRSAKQNDPTNSGWVLNGAGYHFHHDFGAGLVDAESALSLAQSWENLAPSQTISQEQSSLAGAIPDASEEGTAFSFEVSGDLRLEHVELETHIKHSARGQLRLVLISPDGTESLMADVHGDEQADYHWTFMSVRHWGEMASGTWTVKAYDLVPGESGTVESLRLKLHGTSSQTGTDLAIQSFRLINADTDELIQVLEEGDTLYQDELGNIPLSIEALSGSEGSLLMGIRGLETQTGSSRIENNAPYALYANSGSNFYGRKLAPQPYEVFARAYEEDNLQGASGDTARLHFWILPTLQPKLCIGRLALIDAVSDEVLLDSLLDQETYFIPNLAGRQLSFEAFPNPTTVGSVAFEIEGPRSYGRIENVSPYIADGNAGTNYFGRQLPSGTYQVEVTPYPEVRGQGRPGVSQVWEIKLEEAPQDLSLTVYPNQSPGPIQVQAQAEEPAELLIYALHSGRLVYQKSGLRGLIEEEVNLQREGMYIVQFREAEKVIYRTVLIRK